MAKFSSIGVTSLFLWLLQACAPAPAQMHNATVAEAFETSGVVVMPPYTRTVFSSSNF